MWLTVSWSWFSSPSRNAEALVSLPSYAPNSHNPSQLLNPETRMSSLTPPSLPSPPHKILHQILPGSHEKFSQICPPGSLTTRVPLQAVPSFCQALESPSPPTRQVLSKCISNAAARESHQETDGPCHCTPLPGAENLSGLLFV